MIFFGGEKCPINILAFSVLNADYFTKMPTIFADYYSIIVCMANCPWPLDKQFEDDNIRGTT